MAKVIEEKIKQLLNRNTHSKERNIIMIYIILMLNLFELTNDNLIDYLYSHEITLRIKGKGYHNIFLTPGTCSTFDPEFNSYPNDVYINGFKQETNTYRYNFNEDNNYIQLIWNNRFDTCKCMFTGCINITEIDLSNFDTSQVTYMGDMFKDCISLTSLNLSHLDTSKVIYMHYMFYNCKSLISLDLSHFNTSRVFQIDHMFYNCINLEYIILFNFTGGNLIYSNMFNNIPDNAVICIQDIINNEKIVNIIKNKSCIKIDCPEDWKLIQKKVNTKDNTCIDDCKLDKEYLYEYNGKCYNNCSYTYILNYGISSYNIQKNKLKNCLLCSNDAFDFGICFKCKDDYFPKEDYIKTIDEYINCYNNSILNEGYFFNVNNSLYIKCYYRCKTCKIKGNNITHNCLTCKSDYSIKINNNNNYTNCYPNCSYYYYFDENDNFICTNSSECPDEYNKLIPDKGQCIKDCNEDNTYIYEFNNTCLNIYPTEISCPNEEPFELKERKECKKECSIHDLITQKCILKYIENGENILLNNLEKEIISGYNTSNLDAGNNEYIKYEKITITLTTLQYQKNNIDTINMTIVDLNECEIELRKFYNLSNNSIIYIKIIEIIQQGYKIPKILYDVYSKLNNSNLIKLNLAICSNKKIDIYLPFALTENIDELNSSSKYYNDICYPSSSKYDITIKDRRDEFIKKNKTVCQDGCDFSEYYNKINKAKCKCEFEDYSNSIFDKIKAINKDKLLKNFVDIKNIANFNLMKCVKVLFNKKGKGIIYNIGFYITSSIIVFHIITTIIFYRKDIFVFEKKINKLTYVVKKNIINTENKSKIIKKKNNNKFKNKNKNIKIKKGNSPPKKEKKIKQITFKQNNRNINNNKNNRIYNIININSDKKELTNISINNDLNNYNKKKKNKNIILNTKTKKCFIINNINKKTGTIMEYTDEEMNLLSYDKALEIDKRTYCIYYCSLLRTKHNLIFTFFNNNDYNSKIIKKDLFFISFVLSYAVNGLFFNDDTMHNIYESHGSYKIEYQITKIIYSSLISSVINILLKLLALSNITIINFKQNKSKKNINQNVISLKIKLNIKFFSFFIIGFVFLLLFCYYLSMFSAVYKNTQIHLLKDTLISFALSLIYPLGIYLLPGLFRIPALKDPNRNKVYLYKISRMLQLL